jgi:hypothetical protein
VLKSLWHAPDQSMDILFDAISHTWVSTEVNGTQTLRPSDGPTNPHYHVLSEPR